LSRVRAADPPVRVLEHGVGSAPVGDGDLSRSGTFCPNACPARRGHGRPDQELRPGGMDLWWGPSV